MNMQQILERLILKALSEGTLKVYTTPREGLVPAKAKLKASIGGVIFSVSEIPIPEDTPALRIA